MGFGLTPESSEPLRPGVEYRPGMDYSSLIYATEGRIATITSNRHDRLNAIDDNMAGELAAAADRAEDST